MLILLQSCRKVSEVNVSSIQQIKEPPLSIYPHKAELESVIDSIFEISERKGEYAGAGISVVIDNEIVYEKTFGYANSKLNKKLNTNSIFRVGSLSKSFTGVLCAVLEQQNLLKFSEKVSIKLPDFELQNKLYQSQLSIGHLLSHTGGFPYHSYTNLVEDGLTMKKIIPYFAELPNLQAPGTIYSYQNAAFAISGTYLENKFNKSISA